MGSGIAFEQGEIILVPFTNLETVKQRPVLILSSSAVNKHSADFICCGITSNLQNAVNSFLIDANDLERGYLPKPSRIKAGVIFTLEKSCAIKSLGKIREASFRKVRGELLGLF